ncbi:MAG: PcfJ domain-containing protein [Pseudomonadota bacterium]
MCASTSRAGRQAPLESQIRRFPRVFHKRLRKLAKTSSRLGELIFSFPAAAFAMVSDRGSPLARGEAVRLVKEGAPLQAVADALVLPLWLRRLPPEAFVGPLGHAPAGDRFSRQVVNLVPEAPELTAMWLQWVLAADQACDEDFALWIAKQRIWRDQPVTPGAMIPLAVYAWMSQNPQGPAAKQLQQRWTSGLGFGKAVTRARDWVTRVINAYCVEGRGYHGGWRQTTSVGGYKFQPRVTADELRREGEVMRNCVGTYADAVARGDCLIYAIRKGGTSVATLEIQADRSQPGKAFIAQLEGPGNGSAPTKVERAARTWLQRLGDCPLSTAGALADGPVSLDRWRRAWGPYANATGGRADVFSSEKPDQTDFVRLQRCLKTLDALAGR